MLKYYSNIFGRRIFVPFLVLFVEIKLYGRISFKKKLVEYDSAWTHTS